VSVRVIDVDGGRERMSLSLLHVDGRPIERDEAESAEHARQLGAEKHGAPLGRWLDPALRKRA
jgi:ribosomal protein S1